MYRVKILKADFYTYLPAFFILCPFFPSLLPDGLGGQLVFIIEVFCMFLLERIKVYKITYGLIPMIYTAFFFYSVLFSILNDTLREVLIVSDFFEIVKVIAFLLFYMFYRYSNVNVNIIEYKTFRILIIVFLLLSLWSFVEILFPDVFRPISFFLYKREDVLILGNKAVGSFGQTYQFAYALLLPVIISFIYMLKEFSFKWLCAFIVFFITILFTQSRSMYICVFVALILSCFLPVLYSTLKSSVKVFVLVTCVLLIVLGVYLNYKNDLETIFSYAFQGFELMFEGSNGSVNTRMQQLQWAIDNNNVIFWGSGIGKGEMMLESFYSLYYYRYGLLGIVLYLLIPLCTSITSYKIAKMEAVYNNSISIFYYGLFVFYLVTPLGILSSCHQDTPKISFLFYGLIGLVYLKYNKIYNYG